MATERRSIIDRHKGRSWHRETQNAEIWWQDPDSWTGTQSCRGCRYVDCLVLLTVNFSEKFHVDKTFSDLKVLDKTRLPSQSFEFHKSMYFFWSDLLLSFAHLFNVCFQMHNDVRHPPPPPPLPDKNSWLICGFIISHTYHRGESQFWTLNQLAIAHCVARQ